MAIDKNKVDALIFDMDGTLWNAMDSYAEVWNRAFAEYGINLTVTGEMLLEYMGKTIEEIFDLLAGRLGIAMPSADFLKRVDEIEEAILPELGGTLYDGVLEGMGVLSKQYPLFLVSNCGEKGLVNFMDFTHVRPFITDYLSYGMTKLAKTGNLKLIAERYCLKNPVYVGDTQGDCDATHRAGMKFAYCEYGFGECDDYDEKMSTFGEVVKFFNKQKL